MFDEYYDTDGDGEFDAADGDLFDSSDDSNTFN